MISFNRTFNINKGSTYLPFIAYSLLLLVSIAFAYLITNYGYKVGALIIIVVIGLPILLYTLFNLRFGLIILLILSFFLSRIGNFYVDFPLGTLVDTFIFLLLAGLLIRKFRRGDFTIAKSPISYLIWVWILYNFLQFFNPMQTTATWLYAIRSMAGHVIFFFIALEVIKDLRTFRQILLVWIVLAFLGALYGLFQEYHGLLQIEKNWLLSNPRKLNLYTYHGKYRIFSFFNDPTVFGILMSMTSLLCIFLLYLKSIQPYFRFFLIFSAAVMILSVFYTGTRTAYAMLPAGIGIHALLTFQKRTIFLSGIIFIIGSAIIFSDIQSIGSVIGRGTLNRFRSTFRPDEDASFQVRVQNQAFIKPFIQSHPIGAGIGTLGTVGKRFNPDGPLTGFDADSMYVKVAVELGWIGLIIYCSIIGISLILAIKYYYRIHDPELKFYMAALFSILYSIVVANYTQMVTLQLPTAFIFYILLASIIKLKQFDIEKDK